MWEFNLFRLYRRPRYQGRGFYLAICEVEQCRTADTWCLVSLSYRGPHQGLRLRFSETND